MYDYQLAALIRVLQKCTEQIVVTQGFSVEVDRKADVLAEADAIEKRNTLPAESFLPKPEPVEEPK